MTVAGDWYGAPAVVDLVGPKGYVHGGKQPGGSPESHENLAAEHEAAAETESSPTKKAAHLRLADAHRNLAQAIRGAQAEAPDANAAPLPPVGEILRQLGLQ